jgi:putative salt-induced outer membrane protein
VAAMLLPVRPLLLPTLCASAWLLALPARADAPPPPPPEHTWLGSGQAGLLASNTTTSADSYNIKLDLSRIDGPWTNKIYVGGFYSKTNDIVGGERLEGRYELDHKVTDRLFWFVSGDAVRDLFSGFDYQATLAGGMGYKFIETKATQLDATVGVGYQRQELQMLITNPADGAVIQRINGASQGDAVATFGANLAQTLTSTTKLTDKLLITTGQLDTAVANDIAIAVAMSSKLAVSLGYGIRYNSAPPPGVKKLDQLTTVNVVYNINKK